MKLQYYSSIDEMPVFNWFKVHATFDYSWVLIKQRPVKERESIVLQLQWKVLYDQYLAHFGFNDAFLAVLEQKRKIAKLQVKMITSGDMTLETLIEIAEIQLKKQEKDMGSGTGNSFYEIKDYVENRVGYQLDIRRMSVLEFYTKLNAINKKQHVG